MFAFVASKSYCAIYTLTCLHHGIIASYLTMFGRFQPSPEGCTTAAPPVVPKLALGSLGSMWGGPKLVDGLFDVNGSPFPERWSTPLESPWHQPLGLDISMLGQCWTGLFAGFCWQKSHEDTCWSKDLLMLVWIVKQPSESTLCRTVFPLRDGNMEVFLK